MHIFCQRTDNYIKHLNFNLADQNNFKYWHHKMAKQKKEPIRLAQGRIKEKAIEVSKLAENGPLKESMPILFHAA